MFRHFLPLLFVASVWAQNPSDLFEKAPPAVDEALRARITEFFQDHVDGKFRQAEALVAEECKDFYYTSNKPQYLSFEINKIYYSDNFTKAKAVVLAKLIIMMPGFAGKPTPVPIPSFWKVVNGQWYWYVDLATLHQTPFGIMKPSTPDAGAAAPPAPDFSSRPDMRTLMNAVRADKTAVQLDGDTASSERVTISNKLPGNVSLSVARLSTAGLDATLDSTEVKGGGSAVLTISWKPGAQIPPKPVIVEVEVQPTNQAIPIQVTVAPPKK